MPASFSVNSTSVWPTLAETLEEGSRKPVLLRDTIGAGTAMRTLDRANGMERTGSPSLDEHRFGGRVAGKSMDWGVNRTPITRDAIAQTFDSKRGMLTLHLGTGNILDTSI